MNVKKTQNSVNREVEYLDDHEHILLRPGMYIGSVELLEEKLPVIQDNKLILKDKLYSNGFYRLIDEVLDNSFDEAKRCYSENTPMKSISVYYYPDETRIKVIDTGKGFQNGLQIDPKTGLSKIENAFTKLRAGSNFKNSDTEVSIIGMNGVGVSTTNVLSDYFKVISVNEKFSFECVWNNFVSDEKDKKIKKGKFTNTGTQVEFIPNKDVFKGSFLDFEVINTRMFFRYLNLKSDPAYKDLKFNVYWNDKLIDFTSLDPFKDCVEIKINKNTTLKLWNNFNNSTSISFINSSECSGFHTKYITEFINTKIFNSEKASNFYNYFITIDLAPKYIKFADQNKTKFVITRQLLEQILPLNISNSLIKEIVKTQFYKTVQQDILDSNREDNEKLIKKAKKETNKLKISDKYYPSKTKDFLFITEGNSANGSLLQERDTTIHSCYALRGKLKNASNLTDLTTNKELMELISIMDLKLEDKGKSCPFKRIVIANDKDFDGSHIRGLIINFFWKWFPEIIKSNKLYFLDTPIVKAQINKKVKYFFDLGDFNKLTVPVTDIKYFKGLGSLNREDWKYVFSDLKKNIILIQDDSKTDKMINMFFGDNSESRKRWLSK